MLNKNIEHYYILELIKNAGINITSIEAGRK